MRYSCLYTLGGRDNGRPSTVFGSVHNLMFIAWHFKRASILRKREKHLGTFSVHVRLMVLELASLKKKKKKKKKKEDDDFRFFQSSFSRLL